jgi:glycine oxidase
MKIGVVGAGIVGRLLSLQLLELGYRVTLFDKTHATDHTITSNVAAGMLAPYAELESGDVEIFNLAQDAIARWQVILPKLSFRPTFKAEGSLLLAKSQEMPELEHFANRVKRLGIDLALIQNDAITSLEPDLNGEQFTAIHLPEEGYLDTAETMNALAQTLRDKKITWLENTKVMSIKKQTVYTTDQNHHFDQVFDCRGLGAKNAFDNLRAVRGELIWVKAPDVSIKRPVRLMHPRYSLYIVPRFDNHYIIGATSIEAEDYSPISVQSTLELLSACYSVHPGFAEARVVYTATQCRPAFSNNVPKIWRTPDCIRINGMYRHGYLLAPRIVSSAVWHLQNTVFERKSNASLFE